jgi:hypothetical protein
MGHSGRDRGGSEGELMADPVKAEKPKRPYQKPAFEREEVFETMALACHLNPQGHKVGKSS